jgi:hypothetical protein
LRHLRTPDERDEEARLSSHRLRLRVRAARDRRAYRRCRCSRSFVARRRPTSERPAEVDLARDAVRRDTPLLPLRGSVGAGKSIPVPRIISATSVRADDAVHDPWNAPSPPTTTSSSAPSSTACRERGQMPGASEKSTSPTSPSPAAMCASGPALPVEPFADAG